MIRKFCTFRRLRIESVKRHAALIAEAFQGFDSPLERQCVLPLVCRRTVWLAGLFLKCADLHVSLIAEVIPDHQPARHRHSALVAIEGLRVHPCE